MVAAIQATRVSGTAPLAVLFDSTGTTSATAGIDTFRQITYSYNFGDERGLTWAVDGLPKNTQTGGPISAHVFDVAGTYTVNVRATDASGNYSNATVTVTVQDPSTVYAGAKTVCISLTSDFTGCPSSAVQQSTMPGGGLGGSTQWNGKRWLFHAGQDFTSLGLISMQDGNTGVQVGSFGSGTKPVVQGVNIGAWRPATANFATDITVMGLNVQAGMAQSLGSRVLFYGNDVHVAAGSGATAMGMGGEDFWYEGDPYRMVPQSAFYNAREIFFVENNAVGTNTIDGIMGVAGTGSRVALIGNTYGSYQQHSVRFYSLNRGFIAHNELRGISADGIRLALKIHSGGLSPYSDNLFSTTNIDNGWASSQIVIANNLLGNAADNNDWTVGIQPQNDQRIEGVENVIIENNRFVRGIKTSNDINFAARNLTYRNNTVVSGQTLITGIGHSSALPIYWQGPYFAQ